MERRVIHRETEVATLDQMRAAAEALKGVERACDITRAKPEFIEFIRKCSPASVLAVLNQHAALVEQRDLLARTLREVRSWWSNESISEDDLERQFPSSVIDDALAAVEQGEGRESRK